MKTSIATSLLLISTRYQLVNSFAYIDQPDGIVPKSISRTTIIPPAQSSPDPTTLAELATFASTLADAARLQILPHWRSPRNALAQEIKVEFDRSEFQSASPVTLADRAAEAAMREMIEREYPNHGIYGEEYGVVRSDADWVWVLDPIDGTRSFITGKPLFGTLVSCLYKGTPVIGVIDQCVLEERWLGIAGQQSTLNGEPIRTDGVSSLKAAEMYSTSPDMFRDHDLTKFTAIKSAVRTLHFGADCYAYALCATGHCDVVVEADLGLYDYCALVPVLEGAGGLIRDWEGRKLTLENHERSKGRVVACANGALLEEALEILKQKPVEEQLLTVEEMKENPTFFIHDQSVTPLLFGVMVGEVIAHMSM
jgi:inositol-phosphate phosphatase/L-galactose 1-phosphate phosphatase/histidinol-phosphatase